MSLQFTMSILDSDFLVRVNGVLPEIPEVGSPDFSKRAAEIYQTEFKVNTSCSLFAHAEDWLKTISGIFMS